MISVRPVLREIPDPRGKKGRLHRLEAISGLILLSMPGGGKGMKAAFHPGRRLSRRQLDRSGVRRDHKSPCHATLTETSGVPDPEAMAAAFSRLTTGAPDAGDVEPDLRRIAIDGRTLRGSRDAGAGPGMFFRPFVQHLNSRWAIHPHAARGGKFPMRCVCRRRLTPRGWSLPEMRFSAGKRSLPGPWKKAVTAFFR